MRKCSICPLRCFAAIKILTKEVLRRTFDQARRIDANPIANLLMRINAIMTRNAVRIECSILERLKDGPFANRNTRSRQRVGRSLRQTVGKNDRFHSRNSITSKQGNHEKWRAWIPWRHRIESWRRLFNSPAKTEPFSRKSARNLDSTSSRPPASIASDDTTITKAP